ncbi:MAG TPA: maleylpyruvate isomerase family mycothiol-dependent enzyme [Acidimicrobiia bacterium]|nr:maleylpyruvate isomerase family mycothiol-dependent enzyme [Acidimicrobiia bacterium]
MRPAAEILLIEASALRPILESAAPGDFDRPTVCTGWSVRDVLAHCAAALTHVAAGTVHRFTPEDNQADVDLRGEWDLDTLLAELWDGYDAAATAIDAAGGLLDGVGIGEWMHGGDVREAIGAPHAYSSEGSDRALELLIERSHSAEKPGIEVLIDLQPYRFGVGTFEAHLVTDLETFIRLTGDRRPDPDRYRLEGATTGGLVLFS